MDPPQSGEMAKIAQIQSMILSINNGAKTFPMIFSESLGLPEFSHLWMVLVGSMSKEKQPSEK